MAGRAQISWAELDEFPLVRIAPETGNRVLIDAALGNRGETLNWRYEVQHIATAVGLAILPGHIVATGATEGVAGVKLRAPIVTRSLGLLTRKGAPLSPAAAAFRAIAVRVFRASPDESHDYL